MWQCCGFKHEKTKDFSSISLRRSISCFYTDNNKYICFYTSNFNSLRIIVYDNLFNSYGEKSDVYNIVLDTNENIFFKGIHLKEEICFFIYFIKDIDDYPYISIKQCNNGNKIVDYNNFDKFGFSISTFNTNYLLND